MNKLQDFSGLYQLSKTLRFELIPMRETKARFEKWLDEMDENKPNENNIFVKDKAIYDAYRVLKPILDKIHEDFITVSLQSEKANEIDFNPYYNKYLKKESVSEEEKNLRNLVGATFTEGAKCIDNQNNTKPIKSLTDKSILTYIENNIDSYTSDTLTKEDLLKHLNSFKGFFTYFSGYNTNRENYYECKKEQSTAVATRIVNENLPKYCDNIIRFNNRKDEYIKAYKRLKDEGKATQIKNKKTGEIQEAVAITEDVFVITHFNQCLSQPQIEKYNTLIGNYNLLINLYNQSKKKESGFKKLQEFVTLYKQIGCGKGKTLFVALQKDKECELTDKEKKIDEILTVEKLLHTVADAGKIMFNYPTEIGNTTLPTFIEWLRNCDDWRGVYWSKSAVTKISSLYFANWHDLKDKLKSNKACVSFDKNREEQIKINDAVELSGLFDILDKEGTEFVFKQSLFDDEDFKDIINRQSLPSKNLINLICADLEKNTNYFLNHSDEIVKLDKYKEDKSDIDMEDATIKLIKEWFDAANDTMRVVRYFSVRTSKMKGNTANAEMEQMLSCLLDPDKADWSKWYDSIRNYLTQRPQDGVKDNMLKLNFENSSFLNGWSQDYDTKAGLIFEKDGLYYLGINNKKLSDEEKKYLRNDINNNNQATRIILDFQKPDNKNTPRLFIRSKGESFAPAVEKYKLPINDIIDIYDNGKFKTQYRKSNPEDYLKSLHVLIDYFKIGFSRHESYKHYDFKWKDTNEYNDIAEFYHDVEVSCYQIKYEQINWDALIDFINDGKIYLFQIYNKDFSPYSKGTPNMQTLYLQDVLSKNSGLQLCGGAEIFRREPIKGKAAYKHRLEEKMLNKKDIEGKTIPSDIYSELFAYINGKSNTLSEKAQKFDFKRLIIKEVKHEIIKDRRFYDGYKYFFHCPIKINYKASTLKEKEVNTIINDSLNENKHIQFIGIDRGEKHLVYACTINEEGRIVKCGHFDDINGTNYVQKLDEKADERTQARKDWQTIGNISNLKDGYISHVVHKIVDEVIKDEKGTIDPHSYIVLEDLNTEMKRGRQKIEKQVYQKLETALAKKLNFVVDKNSKIDQLASVANALQLTPPIANYQDIEGKKQFGIMLYTRANYTSITDPKTGWRKTIYLKDGNENEIRKNIMNNFSDFGFDGEDYYFEYKEKNANKTWRLYSGKNGISLPRFRNQKQKKENFDIWVPEAVDVVKILKEVFISYDHEKSFKEQISNGTQLTKVNGRSETAWQSLRFVIDLIQQIRNSGVKGSTDDNFLYSPVRDENGNHFDSRNFANNGDLSFIKDADANGAYNIARKGLIMNAHIKTWIENGKPKIMKNRNEYPDLDLFVSDLEWDLWLLNHKKWTEMLPNFASIKAKEE